MEELRIKAYGMELEVKGEQTTVKGAGKDFYEFLDAKSKRDAEESSALIKEFSASMARVEMEYGEQAETENEREYGDCIFQTARSKPTSWASIANDIRKGKAGQLGDKVDFNLKNGERVTVVVTQDTDDYVRFESVDCVGGKDVPWSKEGSTKCGLAVSDVMKYLNGEIWNQLPSDLQEVIELVDRKHKDSDGVVHEYKFTLFLPAASEVFEEDECYGDEGLYEQLEYYKDRRNRMRGGSKGEDTESYWLASARSGISATACSVGDGGDADSWLASSEIRVPFCFCIKKS